MVQMNNPPRGNGIPEPTNFNSEQHNKNRYASTLKQLHSKQGIEDFCVNGEVRPISNSSTKQCSMSKPNPERLLISPFESTNSYYEFKDLNYERIHSDSKNFSEAPNEEVLKKYSIAEQAMPENRLASSFEDVTIDNRMNSNNDCLYVDSATMNSKSISILSFKAQKNRSLRMKDYCDSDFDVKPDETCQISSDFRCQDGMFYGENIECEKSSQCESNTSKISKTMLLQSSDNIQNKNYKCLQNRNNVLTSPKSSQCESLLIEHNKNDLYSPNFSNTNKIHTKKRNSNNPSSLSLPILVFWIYLLSSNYMLTSLIPLSTASSVNDCRGVRYAYLAKGLDVRDIPRQPRQGSELQICPRGLTCCTEEMEKKLRAVSKDQYGEAIQSSASSMQKLFNQRSNKFNGFFTELLIKSKLKFHRLFRRTYGIIYERNSDVFIDFFRDLESYYDHGNVDLEKALQRFFNNLYQRMFTVFNAQHNFDSTYLSCVSQTMKTLQPFGDVPKKLTEQLRRSFVATRTFSQALMKGKQIVNKIVKIQPKDRCVVALTKMSSCPACQGIPEILPCNDYCVNVMKGCLAYHTELDASWDKFIDNLQILADRLTGPFDIEDVVDPIGVKISDAIMNFQNSGYDVTTKVFADCGQPRIQKRQALSHNYSPQYGQQRSGRVSDSSRRHHGGRGTRRGNGRQGHKANKSKLKSYIKETKVAIGETKGFWTNLPYGMCKDNNIATSNHQVVSQRTSKKISSNSNGKDDKCWNGRDAGRYTNTVVNDGLQHQEYNPEVPVDLSRYPGDAQINQQIRALKSITQKIENAHKGLDVEWPVEGQPGDEYYPEGSGDGGECDPDNTDDEDCYYDYEASGYEGSGADIDDNDDDRNNPTWNDHRQKNNQDRYPDTHDSDDDTVHNYPSWVTTRPKDIDNGITVVEGNELDGSEANLENKSTDPDVSSRRTSSGGRNSSIVALYYMIPAFTIWIGSFVTHRAPSTSSVPSISPSLS